MSLNPPTAAKWNGYTDLLTPYINIAFCASVCLNHLGENVGSGLSKVGIVQMVRQVIQANMSLDINEDNILSTSLYSINNCWQFDKYINENGLNLKSIEFINRVIDSIKKFPAYLYYKDSDIIYAYNEVPSKLIYEEEFINNTNDIQSDIFKSSISEDDKILPLVAFTLIRALYPYWAQAYIVNFNTGEDPWNNYIKSRIDDLTRIDWREVIIKGVQGGVIGAHKMVSKTNKVKKIDRASFIGATAASANYLIGQTEYLHTLYPPA